MSMKPVSNQAAHTSKLQKCKRIVKNERQKPRCKYVTQQEVFGGKFSPSPNPPDVVFLPWNRVTLVIPFSGSLAMTVDTVKTKLRAQCDPTGRGFNPSDSGDARFVPSFKISSYQAWNLTGHLISLSVQDFTNTQSAKGGRDQLAGIVDTGAPGILPKVGFKLPASHRNHVLRSDDLESKIEILVIQVGASDQGLLYVNLEYRFDGTAQLPQTKSLFAILSATNRKVNQIEAASHVTAVKTGDTADLAARILAAMPNSQVQTTDQPNSPILYPDMLRHIQSLTKRIEQLECETTSEHSFDAL